MQLVCVHLISSCLLLEHDISPSRATRLLGTVLASRPAFFWLDPPPSSGRLTVRDLLGAADRDDHERRSWAWAAEQWSSWRAHHAQIRLWTDGALR